jgi:uncharacterized damage-inducible protein DinB
VDLMEYLHRQFAYDAWANGEVFAVMKASGLSGSAAKRAWQLLAHILSAERLWFERLKQQPQSLPVWPEFNPEQCEAEIAELGKLWNAYFAELSSGGLSENIQYKNSKGEPWNSSVQDVLTHVVMHSAYHRGQIASLMRANGAVPAYTDFIHAVRQGLIE